MHLIGADWITGQSGKKAKYRRRFTRTENARLPTRYGVFSAVAYGDASTGEDHLALIKGDVSGRERVLVRIHSECVTGDALGSLRCDCGQQLRKAMRLIEREGTGVLLYMKQEGRGIGLLNKVRAYRMQDQGMDTVAANVLLGFEPDERNYDAAAHMIRDLGIRSVVLLTNNPDKINQLRSMGVKVAGREPLNVRWNSVNSGYLRTKKRRMNHMMDAD